MITPQQLIDAYSLGYFPWPEEENEPIAWHNPDPRFILDFDDFKISQSLKKALSKNNYLVSLDRDFDAVIKNCAKANRPEQSGTWITKDIIDAYSKLHKLGLAHSVEAYEDKNLVGGLYGVSLGAVFFGESMFSLSPNASKIAFVNLVKQLKAWDFDFIDCQSYTEHLARFGATHWPRERFLSELNKSLEKETKQGQWRFDDDLSTT